MKPSIILLGPFLAVVAASAQSIIPPMPGKPVTRPTGGGTSGGAELRPIENPKVRYTTHIVLSKSRFWTSTDQKLIEGKLIAFEDLVTESDKNGAQPETPKPPAHPTVVRGEKIRLLMNQKTVEVPVKRLSQADREFIDQVVKSYGSKSPATP